MLETPLFSVFPLLLWHTLEPTHSNTHTLSTQHSEHLPQAHAIGEVFRNRGESRTLCLPLSACHTNCKKWTHKKTHTHRCPTVRGWGQVCSSSSIIPKDSWDAAVFPQLCDSASVRRCLSPHHSASFSFLCSPRPLSALPPCLPSSLLLLSDPLLQRRGGYKEVSLCTCFLAPQTLGFKWKQPGRVSHQSVICNFRKMITLALFCSMKNSAEISHLTVKII